MHSLRCLRIVQIRTVVVFTLISLSITFWLLFYYKVPRSQETTDESQFVFNSHILLPHEETDKDRGTSQQSVEIKATLQLKVKDKRPPLTVPRLAKYCNHAHNHMDGKEGIAPSEYQLLAVHTVIRHGDRSPIYQLPNTKSGELSCLLNTELYNHVSKIVNFPHVMSAEMSKTTARDDYQPFSRWSLFPTHEYCGEGQLTGQGAIQHILNGMHFSERYFHKHKLFTEDDWPQRVFIHSTEVSRTYQSAIAFAYGLLPNFNREKLRIVKSSTISFCSDSVYGMACRCQKMETLRAKAEMECKVSLKVKQSLANYKTLLNYVSNVLEVSPHAIPSPTFLMDGLSGYQCHNNPFPCNVNGTCINSGIMEALWEVIDTKSKCLGKSEFYNKYSRALMHGLLSRIATNFNTSMENNSLAKFQLYSGHDTTVSPLIAALGLSDNVWPGYAHMITFELWKKDGDKKEKYIRILQEGRIVTDQVIFCGKYTDADGMCQFSHFLDYLRQRSLRRFCLTGAESFF